MIRNDIQLAEQLYRMVEQESELEPISTSLSITAFRYVPADKKDDENYLNKLNETLLNELQTGGKVFLSNAVVEEKYCLRVCVVNFRTTVGDLKDLVQIVLEEGNRVNKEMER
jgi:glutamate/tyrosine decarboxylase-like PLP-dependent enzyme